MLQILKTFIRVSLSRMSMMVLLATFSVMGALPVHAEEVSHSGESAQILQEFNKQHRDAEHAKSITDKDKQRIMFLLGVVLIILVLITGGLGLAMGVYGKSVFVSHMVFAALSVTLAIVHAIVGLVWFYPF
jgi:F0F1-type ATP synthase membrane subunit a